MTTIPAERELVSVEEYLAAEELSDIKHEYRGGMVYAMSGASEAHNIIAMNLYALLHNSLRGTPCQAFGSNMKVRLEPLGDTYFYYPDAMVACDLTDCGHGWRERPSVLFEIVSESTRRVDTREKRLAYLQLASLDAYVRLEQDRVEVTIDRRTPAGWVIEKLNKIEEVIALSTIQTQLPLAELYERLPFASSGQG